MANALTRAAQANSRARTNTPLTQRTPGRTDEVRNGSGSYVFMASEEARLNRFMILGTDGGKYGVSEKTLTNEQTAFVREMIRKDEALVRKVMVDVSTNNRAYKQGPALYTLAALLIFGQDKAATRAVFNDVARTSTHLFEVATYIKTLGGWGRSKKDAIASWYTSKNADQLAYQAVKYRQRDGWSHRDLFRLAHPKGVDVAVGNFILGKGVEAGPGILDGFRRVQAAKSAAEVIRILNEERLPWETIPTQFHKDAEIWKTLFYTGQLNGQALVRNVVRLSRLGAFSDMKFAGDYADRLADVENIRKGRMHPINYLNAAVTYEEGQIDRDNQGWRLRRKKDWMANARVLGALQAGFNLSFANITPSGKSTLLGVDVSGSMQWAAVIGCDLSAAQVAGAMALVTAKTEPYCVVYGFADRFVDLGITENDSLATATAKVQKANFGSTDMSLPMQFAKQNRIKVETFGILTDNDINRGRKPTQALDDYRQSMGIGSRLGVFATSVSDFTIADPKDPGQMDFVGFDAAAPKVFADFSAGRI